MSEYQYKGFHIRYEIKPVNSTSPLYLADGCINRYKQKGVGQKFHTENTSFASAKRDLTKLIEDYIDFEWKEFHACADLEKGIN